MSAPKLTPRQRAEAAILYERLGENPDELETFIYNAVSIRDALANEKADEECQNLGLREEIKRLKRELADATRAMTDKTSDTPRFYYLGDEGLEIATCDADADWVSANDYRALALRLSEAQSRADDLYHKAVAATFLIPGNVLTSELHAIYEAGKARDAYVERLAYCLKIYEHAHTSGNSVPPNIVAEARAALASAPTNTTVAAPGNELMTQRSGEPSSHQAMVDGSPRPATTIFAPTNNDGTVLARALESAHLEGRQNKSADCPVDSTGCPSPTSTPTGSAS